MRKIAFGFVLLLVVTLAIPVAATQPLSAYDMGTPVAELPAGYVIEPLVTDLDFPTGIAIHGARMWVGEAGVPPAGVAKIKEIDLRGNVNTILTHEQLPEGTFMPPLLDATYHRGWLWISHNQMGANGWSVGAMSKFMPQRPVQTFTTVLTNLPSAGDHATDEIVFDRGGRAYFSQGSATNTSVVGPNNLFITGWLDSFPEFHDFAPVDIYLNGREFTSLNPLTEDPDDTAVTPPYHPFNYGAIPQNTLVPAATPSDPQNGMIIGGATVYSFEPRARDPAATLKLEGWGFRNPFGIGLDPFNPGTLFVSNNGSDVRGVPMDDTFNILGSRPVANDLEDLFIVELGGEPEFYGWPDYFHDPETGEVLPVTDPLFCTELIEEQKGCPDFVLDDEFRAGLNTQAAFAQMANHSSANKFDFAVHPRFGFQGDIFLAQTGAFVPVTGADEFTGYKVVRIDRETGEVFDFIVNAGDSPEELLNPDAFVKPIDVKFFGKTMLIVDFGIYEPGLGLFETNTGKVWMVKNTRPSPSARPFLEAPDAMELPELDSGAADLIADMAKVFLPLAVQEE